MIATTHCELLVVGAGPAGLAAATIAAQQGVATILLDEQAAPGGQIYRAMTSTPILDRKILGEDYWHGESLLEPFKQSGAQYLPGATVWAVVQMTVADATQGFEVGYSVGGEARMLHAKQIVLATGAQERPFPIPGWTLPGVMTAGAAQVLLKSSGLVPGKGTILAGCGPLLYLIAWQYLNAGIKVDALLDTTPPGRLGKALRHAWGFLTSPYLVKGLKLLREVKAQVRIVKGVTALEALPGDAQKGYTQEGNGQNNQALQSVRFTAGGRTETLAATQLLLHQGVIPNINLAQAVGVEQQWNELLLCWEPKVDSWGGTNVLGVSIAGDGGGIAGAWAAEHRGRLSALQVAHQLGKLTAAQRDAASAAPRAAFMRAVQGREFFDTLYQAPEQFRLPTGDTIVCRCEEITAAQVRETVSLGCPGPNQMKSFLRCGMGPCQGRFCSVTVTELIAQERNVTPQEVGHYRLRFPTKPLTLGELAALPQTADSKKAVIRLKKPV